MMAQSASGTSSTRRHARDHDTASVSSSRFADTEWEAKEAVRQRELEEAKARAAQMEKTMRWWSDCTANWREKWSKVRTERNKSRDEAKQLRSKLDSALKDVNSYKREKQDLHVQNEQLQKEIEKIHLLLLKHAGQFDSQIFEALGDEPMRAASFAAGDPKNEVDIQNGAPSSDATECDESTATSLLDFEREIVEEHLIRGGAMARNATDSEKKCSDSDGLANGFESKGENRYEQEFVAQKVSMLQLRLDEANKTVQIEREEKSALHRSIERLTGEIQELRDKCEELRATKQDSVRELLALQDAHKEEMKILRGDLQDEANSREGMDRRLNDLRAELERLQAENAAEWGKRERLETEKLTIERENKKIRIELRDIQERLERKGRPLTNSDVEIRQLQQELTDKNKELADLKHAQNKLKKMVQDKTTELSHTARRAEQYEVEVKKLRGRVEELKRDLAVAEDELDTAGNNIRKLQRSNDELQEQADNFQVQLQHLHSSGDKEDGGEEMAVLDEGDCARGSLLVEDGSDEDLSEY